MGRPEARTTYHHGDLANALVEAAVELAREGGPQAIVLREAARRVGVSATSAYRHFADYDDLTGAVKLRAQRALTDAMLAEPVPAHNDAQRQALARLRALGRGYLRFAQAEPGLFRAAFNLDAPSSGTSESFALLADALDGLVASGAMASARRPGDDGASAVDESPKLFLDGCERRVPAVHLTLIGAHSVAPTSDVARDDRGHRRDSWA